MNKFIMMVGLPGSGKSTLAKQLSQKENGIVHSSDNLRQELFGDENNQDNNQLLFQELNKRINKDLSDGKSVVYDATNLSYKKRKLYLDRIKAKCYKKCILVATPYEKCLRQNNDRSRKVPELVMEKMYRSFFVPQYYEGWDHIEIVFNTDEEYELAELFKDLNEISQDNSYHSLTIGEHCKKCAEYMDGQYNDEILTMAALLHDIGKKFTKRFEDRNGIPTKEAHFYSHQNVSAYLSLFYLKHMPVEKILKITNYIQWHMQPFNFHTEKARTKSANLLGKEVYNNLLRLHEADVNASGL